MKKGFTLIELLAVLVVLAILALISIPITIRVINSARENSYKRSIANYGRAVETYIEEHLISNSGTNYKDITYEMIKDKIKTNGNSVICDNLSFEDNGDIILNYCHTPNSKTYRYKNRQVTLQKDTYEIGDLITVKGMDFNVIADSSKEQEYVVALKTTPLTVAEVNKYRMGSDGINYVNRYTVDSVGEAKDINGYGGVAFYSSDICNSDYYPRCDINYNNSDIKVIIDNWASDILSKDELQGIAINDLQNYDNVYKVRLMRKTELQIFCPNGTCDCSKYQWLCNKDYHYWTMDIASWLSETSIGMDSDGKKGYPFADYVYANFTTIRPVINVKKSAIEKSD